GEFFEQRTVGADQAEGVGEFFQPHPAVAADQVLQVDRQVARQRELAVRRKDGDHVAGGHAGGGGVPERERRNPIGVNVFRAFFQLGERGQRVTGGGVFRV